MYGLKFSLALIAAGLLAKGHAQNVGIGTATPKARLHVVDSMVLFQGPGVVSNTPPDFVYPGNGVYMMWIPQYAAFRVGFNGGGAWNVENTGRYSFAAGAATKASGNTSTAFGDFTEASGFGSFAAGSFTRATGAYSTAFGRYNIGGGNPNSSWLPNDPLFEIGNGTSSSLRNNALTILKDGKTGINTHLPNARLAINAPVNEDGLTVRVGGATRLRLDANGRLCIGADFNPLNDRLYVSGTSTFDGNVYIGSGVFDKYNFEVSGESRFNEKVNIGNFASAGASLHIRHYNATAGLMPDQGIRIQNMSGTNRFWTLYTFSSNGNLALYSSTGDGVSVGNFNAGTGAYTATSNRHLKTNVQLLDADVLARIQQLKPATYSYIRDPLQQRTVGFMAEDVQPIFPELVENIGENGENMAINYAGFSVVAIKAIQEQQNQIDRLTRENNELKEQTKELLFRISEIEDRINQFPTKRL